MNRFLKYLMAVCLFVAATSCEERTGYYDSDQKSILAKLTSVRWVSHGKGIDAAGKPSIDNYQIYNFETDGNGSFTYLSESNGEELERRTRYFQWTFTTENFAVIFMTEGYSDSTFWLIEKLTDTQLWVKSAMQDPVLYPGVHQNSLRFEAEEK